jgi:hypothetical protein
VSNPLGLFRIDPRPVLGRFEVPQLESDNAFVSPDRVNPQEVQRTEQYRRRSIPGPIDVAISLTAARDTTFGKCGF